MVSWIGFRQIAVMYARAERRAGASKYPLLKMLQFAADGVLSFSLTPLRLALWVGFLSIGLAFAGILYALIIRLYTNDWVRGWTSIFTAVLFIGGAQLSHWESSASTSAASTPKLSADRYTWLRNG
ncbi:MAG: hypothetical protein ABJA18_05525 [bacterium]